MKAELRAGLIALVILSQAVAAIPNPPELKDSALKDPSAQAELDAWVDNFAAFGIEKSREEVHALGKWWTARLRGTREALVWPFKPIFQFTGTGQGWGLFAFPDMQPHRFEIAVYEDGAFRDVYVDLDPDADFMAPVFAARRVRAVYNPGNKPPPAFDPFTDWLADQVFEAHPDAEKVRIGFRRSLRLKSGEPHPGYSKRVHFTRVFDREAP
ncbi:MAG: hypothetical protein KC912_03035 [Proteobacteria bacterium]|nr:hypothetical protein [Pseudomonadota bacterium]